MDKIRIDFFDILGYLIPGTALLFSLWITADATVTSLADLYGFVNKIDTKTIFSGIVVAYIFGFTLHFFGSRIFAMLHHAPRKIPKADLPHDWVLIREHAEKHLVILDRWQALKALASNLAAFSLIAVFLCLIKWAQTDVLQWAYLAPFFFCLFLIYVERAKVFHSYLDNDSFAVLTSMHLKEKHP